MTNLSLLKLLCEELEVRRPCTKGRYEDLITFVKDRPGHDRRYAINAAKAKRELGWSPQETLATGLGRTLDWYLTNRAWCDAITQGTYQRDRLGLG